MEKKTKWMFNDDKKHFFKKNPKSNRWEEYLNNKWQYTFESWTYDGSNIILFSKIGQEIYIELSRSNVKISYGFYIHYLDSYYDEYKGSWILSERVECRFLPNNNNNVIYIIAILKHIII